MQRPLGIIVLLTLGVTGCGSEGAGHDRRDGSKREDGSKATSLKIAISGSPTASENRSFAIDCPPQRDADRAACHAIDRNPKLFAETPSGRMCTQNYGGPQRARVTGTIRGRRVNTTVTRTDGCEISRWDGAQAVLGPVSGAEYALQ